MLCLNSCLCGNAVRGDASLLFTVMWFFSCVSFSVFFRWFMTNADSSNNRSFLTYLFVGVLVVLTVAHIAIMRFRQHDFGRYADSPVPRIIELNQSKRVPFTQNGINTVVSGILKNDMRIPEGMRPVDKQTLSESQWEDLHDAIASFLITYHSPTPQSVYDYYITNRGGEKMQDGPAQRTEDAIESLQIDVDRTDEPVLMYVKARWQYAPPERLKTHWQYMLDGVASSSCVWEASSPLVSHEISLNNSDRDVFGNVTNVTVFFECTTNPDDLLRAGKKVVFADVQFAIELDETFHKEIVIFGRRYWFNVETGKWFPYDGTAFVTTSQCDYYPRVMF